MSFDTPLPEIISELAASGMSEQTIARKLEIPRAEVADVLRPNRRRTPRINWREVLGMTLQQAHDAGIVTVTIAVVHRRVKSGMPPYEAATRPAEPIHKNSDFYRLTGLKFREASAKYGIPMGTIKTRLKLGWPVERLFDRSSESAGGRVGSGDNWKE